MEQSNANVEQSSSPAAGQSGPTQPTEPKKFNWLFVIIVALVAFLAASAYGAYYYWQKSQPKACTQEAKQCPDGSYVSRIGPNCEFAACPTDWHIYKNTEYGFQITFTDAWRGFRAVKKTGLGNMNMIARIAFEAPTADKVWNDGYGYVDIFDIDIYLFSEWEELKLEIQKAKEEGRMYFEPNYIDRNDKYVFVWSSIFQDTTPKDVDLLIGSTNQIISTFKFINDQTADWQTYRNEKYGFEFRYPKEWDNIVESVDKSYVGFFNEERFAAVYNDYGGLTPGFFAEQREFAAVDVNMYKKGSLVGTENLIVNEGIDLKQFVQNVIRLCRPESLEEIKLGDNLAYRCSVTTTSGRDEKIVYSKLNGNILTISTISGYDYKDYDTLLNVFNKILSTFKFINDQTADWQTYRNEKYGFEIKYPKYYKAADKKASVCKAGQTYDGVDSLKPGQKVYEIIFCFLKEPLSYWLAKPEKDNSVPDFSIALFSEDDYYRKELLNSPIYDLSINSLESFNSNRFEKIENLGWEGYRFYNAYEAGWEEDFYLIPIKDKGLILEIGFYKEPGMRSFSGLDIISTFKFTK
ncbi:MAG: Uncharacterized protein LiPW39_158 [Parcubacteria group bacterium LiPW_39]|nr:MAG: Uncharacterized protein LiPW39_158 [Parcubacteria group bacterium LiPW_39]